MDPTWDRATTHPLALSLSKSALCIRVLRLRSLRSLRSGRAVGGERRLDVAERPRLRGRGVEGRGIPIPLVLSGAPASSRARSRRTAHTHPARPERSDRVFAGEESKDADYESRSS